jgi:YspA, cpYpsA-related SLOG family
MTTLFIVKSPNVSIKKIGITGGRNYTNKARVRHVLDMAYRVLGDRMFLVVGCARGVDAHAREWAADTLLPEQYAIYHADWHRLGKSAGHQRNRMMLHSGLDMLIAFPGGVGTENMLSQTRKLNEEAGLCLVKIMEVDRE